MTKSIQAMTRGPRPAACTSPSGQRGLWPLWDSGTVPLLAASRRIRRPSAEVPTRQPLSGPFDTSMNLAQTATADCRPPDWPTPFPTPRLQASHHSPRIVVTMSQSPDVNASMSRSNRPWPRKASVECPATTPSTTSPALVGCDAAGSAYRRGSRLERPAAHVAFVSRRDVNPTARIPVALSGV